MAEQKAFETRLHTECGLGGEVIIGERSQVMIVNYTVLLEGQPLLRLALPLGMTDVIELDSLCKFRKKAVERSFDTVVRGETTMSLAAGQMPYFTFHRLGGVQLALDWESDWDSLCREIKSFILQGEQSSHQVQLIKKYKDYNSLGYKI